MLYIPKGCILGGFKIIFSAIHDYFSHYYIKSHFYYIWDKTPCSIKFHGLVLHGVALCKKGFHCMYRKSAAFYGRRAKIPICLLNTTCFYIHLVIPFFSFHFSKWMRASLFNQFSCKVCSIHLTTLVLPCTFPSSINSFLG